MITTTGVISLVKKELSRDAVVVLKNIVQSLPSTTNILGDLTALAHTETQEMQDISYRVID